jgi:hypothetical protein
MRLQTSLQTGAEKQLKEVQSMPRDDGGQKTEDGEQEIRITGGWRIWNWLNGGCQRENLQVKCVGG